jgi:uncharacterized lipoprotein YajG
MSVRFRAHAAVSARQVTPLFRHLFNTAAVLAALALLAGCAGAPNSPFVGADPSDPAASVATVGYRSTIAPYRSQRPVAPASWREQNRRVAPAAKE